MFTGLEEYFGQREWRLESGLGSWLHLPVEWEEKDELGQGPGEEETNGKCTFGP